MIFFLIFSKFEQEHAKHLRLVLGNLHEHHLYAKFSKCEFWKTFMEFLGHVLSSEGVAIDPSKVTTVQKWQSPKFVFQV
jgi:hypothetical protein